VINNIHALALFVKKSPEFKAFPTMEEEDFSKTKSLFSISLIEGNFNAMPTSEAPTTPFQEELIEWFNSHLAKKEMSSLFVKNLGSDLRTGVKLIHLLEVQKTCYGKSNKLVDTRKRNNDRRF
jgi:hypothetical protein